MGDYITWLHLVISGLSGAVISLTVFIFSILFDISNRRLVIFGGVFLFGGAIAATLLEGLGTPYEEAYMLFFFCAVVGTPMIVAGGAGYNKD